MAVKSMTGFGSASENSNGVRVSVELSSVNRKQLDVVFRLPPQLSALESRIQKIIQEQISRGRISGNVQLEAANGGATVQIDLPRAEKALQRASERLTSKDPSVDVVRAQFALARAHARIKFAK